MLNMPPKVKWLFSKALVPYPQAMERMEGLYQQVREKKADGFIWLLEHPALWTAGLSAQPSEVLSSALPLYQVKRGGKTTYHGPGQRVIYLVLDIRDYTQDGIRAFIGLLENWLIGTLGDLGVLATKDAQNIGIWVGEKKIAALGIHLRHGISTHGLAVNVCPDLTHYDGIIPCGIEDKGITSLADLGTGVSLTKFDEVLKANFCALFQIPLANLQSQHFDPARTESF